MLNDRRIRTSLVAIAADLVLTLLKAVLAFFTGSAALLADAYHSLSDFVVSFVLMAGLFYRRHQEAKNDAQAIQKARRVESILAIIVAFIILYVPVEIVQALQNRESEAIANIWLGLLGTLVVIAIVFFMSHLKTHVGRETDSPALEADGYHSMVDVFSSAAVLLSLVGYMMGVNLDTLVALLIAALIAVSGLELLFAGFRSLLKGSDFDQLSFIDLIAVLLKRSSLGRWFQGCIKGLYRYRYMGVALILGAYGVSGFRQVPLGYSGLHQRFNQVVAEDLSPGLHFLLPWPVDSLNLLPVGERLSVTVGTSPVTDLSAIESRLWREIKASRVHSDDVRYMVTGDENLIDIELTLVYTIEQSANFYRNVADIEPLVSRYLEYQLWQQLSQRSFEGVLATKHNDFAEAVAESTEQELKVIGIDIRWVDAQIQGAQPPAMVVSSYRDVFTADQERQQRVNRVIAQASSDLPLARADFVTQMAEVESEAMDRELTAQADVARVTQLADVYEQSPLAFQFNHYINELRQALEDKPITVVDPLIDSQQLRTWLGRESKK